MSETTALQAVTSGSGAVYRDEGGWLVPASFGHVEAETVAASDDAIVADVSHWGRFTLAGKDGPKFVQGLTTNDILSLASGAGCYTAFLNVHGRIEADAHVYRFPEEFLIQTPPEAADWLAASLGRFVRAGDFRFARLDSATAALTLQGPRTYNLLATTLGVSLERDAQGGCRLGSLDGEAVRILGTRRSRAGGVDVVGAAPTIARLWARLVAPDGMAVRPAGEDALDIMRMEAGIPRFGRDFDNGTVLQEIDMPEIVSFTKGCYLGQEIVARLHYLGQPSKLLRRLEWSEVFLPEAGDRVVATVDDGGAEAGVVTSAVMSPSLGPIVFGVVKRKYNAPGARLFVKAATGFVPVVVRERREVGAVEGVV